MTAPHDSCTLLVVDACPDTQARILEHVQGRGFSTITAQDPSSALATIDLTAPDIVITDLFLPDGGGLALTKALRARHEPCPVIVMGTGEGQTAVVHALRAGAVDYLPKPVAEEELAHALQRARHLLPADLADTPGVRRSEYRLTIDSNPAHIPGIVSWLVKTTASTLPETRRLHLRGTLQELLYNAIEHGNLEIYYHEKQRAIAEDRYDALVEQRLKLARLNDRSVVIHVLYDKTAKTLRYRIADEGAGFKWRTMLSRSRDACRSEDVNGRGIYLAKSLFPDLTYNDRGNEVTITVPLE
jgi:two-component system cell cycle response regulator